MFMGGSEGKAIGSTFKMSGSGRRPLKGEGITRSGNHVIRPSNKLLTRI